MTLLCSRSGTRMTIGWIYQSFHLVNCDQARKASHAPRDSRELAFRNQFYTPRYVVRFLVDNTLGRITIRMMAGQTRLNDTCEHGRYRSRQPQRARSYSAPEEGSEDIRIIDQPAEVAISCSTALISSGVTRKPGMTQKLPLIRARIEHSGTTTLTWMSS